MEYSVREERILAKLDTWLATLGQPDQVDGTVRSILTADKSTGREPAEVVKARRDRHRLQAELDRIITAIRAGMDAKLAVSQTRELQTRIETAASTIERWERSAERAPNLTESQVRDVLAESADLVGLLHSGDRVERGRVYQSLNLNLRYEKEATTGRELVRAQSQLCGGGGRI